MVQPGLYHIVPAAGVVILVASLCYLTAQRRPIRAGWAMAALLAAAFGLWSFHAVVSGGALGFWPEHVRNAWSNQIWLDLLCAAGTAFTVILPRARATGMWVWGWLALILATGSLGLLAMYGRCLWLEGRGPLSAPRRAERSR
jgi:hypothetical protein